MRVVVAPDSFKGSLAAADAARAVADGWRARRPDDDVRLLPLADGGEGTLDAFAAARPDAVWHTTTVPGPDGRPVDAGWLLLPEDQVAGQGVGTAGGRTAVLELARASGLPLLRGPDPRHAHTYGLGAVAAAALDAGATALVIGLGGSASTDGGTGALRALGLRLRDREGRDLPLGGAALAGLAYLDRAGLRPPPPGGVRLLVDVTAPLTGPAGAAAVFGPQKGAGPDDVAVLDAALRRLADSAGGDPDQPGAGAAGGTGYGLAALWGARIVPGAAAVAELAGLPEALAGADLVVTGEGRFDETSLRGKVVGALLDTAAAAGVPVQVVAGQLGAAPPEPVTAAVSLVELAGSTASALAEPGRWLREAGGRLAAQVRPVGQNRWPSGG
ncbi:glycerate kinase [Micromonospora sp. WMMD1128]|uniref:glycerate kinase n=1 Tax=Micromonospora sp. WMMD1128 TaxID=3015150 RepID=UPI00248B769E|nr:glycerate kinase [Micromonospora sp. WMMD1128]WBB76641.1 glycerate kinase [Micromonospora sp. WMMD1128]